MNEEDIRIYNRIIRDLGDAVSRTDALIDRFRDELTALETKKKPAKKDVSAAVNLSEKIINHVLASRYMSEALNALRFYEAVLEGIADEEDNDFDPDEFADVEVPLTDEEINLMSDDYSFPGPPPGFVEVDDSDRDEDFPGGSPGAFYGCGLMDDGIVFIHRPDGR